MSERILYESYLFASQSFQTNVECINPSLNPGIGVSEIPDWEMPLNQQPKDQLSKSPRNMEKILNLGEIVVVDK